MPTASSTRKPTVRSATAEQFAPVTRAHAELVSEATPVVDAAGARARIANGQVAYDAIKMVRTCGALATSFGRVLEAFQVAGFASNEDCQALLDRHLDVDEIVCGWLTGDRTPRDVRRGIARQAAIIVGNAILGAASSRVGAPSAWRKWTRPVCPCCGGAPDIVVLERGAHRSLICARCDAQWRAGHAGCLGCEATEETGVARINNPALGYDLVMCHACGRFYKERPRRGMESLIVERALTAELDFAAEQRGLRL
ncbi:MAG: formate dehydrogenase accessory protein FdhE [bacterium]